MEDRELNLRKFIQNNKQYIDAKELDKAYADIPYNYPLHEILTGDFTNLLYKIDIDPLRIMKEVPPYFLYADLKIKEIYIPKNIHSIGEHAFHLSSLENLIFDLKSACEYIGRASFSGSQVKHMEFPDTLKVIDEGAFVNCNYLISCSIPINTIIRDYAFAGSMKLKRLLYKGTINNWKTKQNGVNWYTGSNIEEIHCKDGILKIPVKEIL